MEQQGEEQDGEQGEQQGEEQGEEQAEPSRPSRAATRAAGRAAGQAAGRAATPHARLTAAADVSWRLSSLALVRTSCRPASSKAGARGVRNKVCGSY